MKLAMADLDMIWEEKETNKNQCRQMMEEAARRDADVILFPEMTLTGFSMDVERIQDRNKETVSFFTQLAREYELAAGFGYVTMREGKGRNHFCLVDAGGTCLEDYEKLHPFTYGGEAEVYEGGDRICHAVLAGLRCGMFICYDLRFPESFQKLPMDTDAVFVIANWPESRLAHWYTLLQARAIEMQCYVVGVNRTGTGGGITYAKSSAAFAPDGSCLPEEEGTWNRYVLLDRERRLRYIERFPVRQDRRYGIDYI